MILRALLLASLLVSAAACGGKSLDNPDGGDGDSGNTDGGPQPGPDCPVSAPSQGASCSIDSIECEYGSDIRSTCNAVATCDKGSWNYSQSDDPSCPTTANVPACPASADQATGTCSPTGTVCNYSTSSETRFCSCMFLGGPIMEDGGNAASWQCSFGTSTGCPAVRPKIGASCTQADLLCNYDSCGTPEGLSFECSSHTNTWTEGFGDVCAGAQ